MYLERWRRACGCRHVALPPGTCAGPEGQEPTNSIGLGSSEDEILGDMAALAVFTYSTASTCQCSSIERSGF